MIIIIPNSLIKSFGSFLFFLFWLVFRIFFFIEKYKRQYSYKLHGSVVYLNKFHFLFSFIWMENHPMQFVDNNTST